MIIHIGQLVDLEVVQEAIEKVNKKIALEMQKKEEEERMKGEEQKEQIVSLLAREGTIATLSQTDQVKYKIAGFLFETFWETMLTWICVIDAALIGLYITKSSFFSISAAFHQTFSVIFLLEMLLKLYSIGLTRSTLRKVNTGLVLDFLSILLNFIFSILCTLSLLDLRFGLVALLRLVNVVRVPMANKVILEDLDKKLMQFPPFMNDSQEMNAFLQDPESFATDSSA
jgi:membrane-associated HD superfamily phosphohydrolase